MSGRQNFIEDFSPSTEKQNDGLMTKLSICIPTYNFGKFIGETLQSIAEQASGDVEILVVDGASTDDTALVVKRFTQLYGNVKYHLLDRKGGIDVDIARSVELASGDFCWLFSSDDIMADNAIETVLERLDQNLDLLLCTHINCKLDMTPIRRHPVLSIDTDMDFDFEFDSDLDFYFNSAITTEAFFSFMSGLIINRTTWNTVDINPEFVGSCWAHAARLFEINSEKGLKLRYLAEPLLLRRGGNDSFATNGLVKRFAIAIDGYNKIANKYFGESSTQANHIRRTLRNEYSLKSFLYAKYLCYENPDTESIVHLNVLVDKFYCDPVLSQTIAKMAYRSATHSLLSIGMRLITYIKTLRSR